MKYNGDFNGGSGPSSTSDPKKRQNLSQYNGDFNGGSGPSSTSDPKKRQNLSQYNGGDNGGSGPSSISDAKKHQNLSQYNGGCNGGSGPSSTSDPKKRQNLSQYNGGGNGGSGPSNMFDPKKRQNLSHCFASTPSIKSDKANLVKKMQKKPLMAHVENTVKSSDDNSVRTKIEVAKRRIQERYLEADNAKKQRTVRVLEFEDLPKRGLICQPSRPKQGNTTKACDRHWRLKLED